MMSDGWNDEAIARAIRQTRRIERQVTDFPHITEQGRWVQTRDGIWTGGFWAGLLWLTYQQEKDAGSREKAAYFTDRLLARVGDRHNHDLGFMFVPSAVKGWQLTGEKRYHDAAVSAAETLASQYNPDLGFIPGWGFFGAQDWAGRMLVDTLMNMPLLVWAVGQGADRKLMDVVRRHTATALKYLLRENGSVYHVFDFNPTTGAPLQGGTYQGYGPQSTWARGQSWAITALAILAAMTGDKTYLAASEKIAAHFTALLPADSVPPWDFDAPGPKQPKDASAGSAAAYGFLKLYAVTGENRYLATASRLLRSLASTCSNNGESGGLLLHATADLPHGLGVDESTMYGDYYYLKALIALRNDPA
jgi:unsaturated chondroitin disaccharide hydrolase